MAKKEFQAESKKLMDMMINSIYTNKEIFLRELISNASDAIDKLYYKSLTDPSVGMNKGDFRILLTRDKDNRLLTVSDNGIGMTKEELEQCAAVRRELGSHFCRRCGYCAPCPNGIDIPSNFLMANYLRRYGLADWARARYAAMPYHAGSCVQCGACETRCPYELPIRDMLVQVARDFGY